MWTSHRAYVDESRKSVIIMDEETSACAHARLPVYSAATGRCGVCFILLYRSVENGLKFD